MLYARPPLPSLTINKLLAIQPGERVVYYNGNLPFDIKAAEHSYHDGHPTPKYAQLLRQLEETANELQKLGRVNLKVLKASRAVTRTVVKNGMEFESTQNVTINRYVAEGV